MRWVDAPTSTMSVEPVVLEGVRVRLEPMQAAHYDALRAVGADPSIWQWTLSYGGTAEAMRDYVDDALKLQAEGAALPFVTIDRASGQVVGSTRFARIDRAHRKLELGYTWIAPAFQRSGINTEAKYLQLRHAFETLGALRVEIHCDACNERSRRAIERIGATFEGICRNSHIAWRGNPPGQVRLRDSVVFSILDSEWARVKQHLEGLMR